MLRVSDIFARHAARPFLLEEATGRAWTYGDFHALVGRAAGVLAAHGVGAGDRVGLLLNNSTEFGACYFAAAHLGAVGVPINPAFPPDVIGYIIATSRVKIVVCSPGTRERCAHEGALAIRPGCEQGEGIDLEHAQVEAPPEDPRPDQLSFIFFTSGTTSMPKGVCHRFDRLLANAEQFQKRMRITPENRFLHLMPMAYMAGFLNTLLCPFVAGASVLLAPQFNARTAMKFWKGVVKHEADTFWMAPTMVNALLRLDRDPQGPEWCRTRAHALPVGTAPLSVTTQSQFLERYGKPLLESYGLSELLLVTLTEADQPCPGSVGRLLDGVQLRAEGDGELSIRSPYTMLGYLDPESGQPELVSAETWFPTGDLGHLDGDGFLHITGRKKDLIIRGGLNISPISVEEALLRHPEISETAVVGVPNEFYGEEVVAAVVLKSRGRLSTLRADLAAHCAERLMAEAVPTRFLELDELPRNPSGKVDKREIRKQIVEAVGIA